MPRDELTAFGAAYDVLVRLDKPARERALTWLSRVLETGVASDPTPEVESPEVAVRSTKAASGATRTRKKAVATAAKTKTAAKSRAGRAKEASKSSSSERPYRRMPDPQEVVDAFHNVGSMSGLAEFYGVPRHTINDWARRMRGMGYEIGRSAKA